MRFLAMITTMLAWLAYGTMSAWAGCPMCVSTANAATIDVSTHQHAPGMHMDERHSAPAKNPCSSGGVAHVALCVACIAILPATAAGGEGKQVFSYPAPAASAALPDARPAPVAPPPRLL
ncbi:hypothetical protein ASC90_11565 [Rhizobium sp. Root1220]|nr:hypothetical protein [Rhizobium sp. Root1220]KQV68452.1 hypothetical protein ASC90_11565 [Rhizobium sp. Root1220]